jgi:hypothetical protein
MLFLYKFVAAIYRDNNKESNQNLEEEKVLLVTKYYSVFLRFGASDAVGKVTTLHAMKTCERRYSSSHS